METDPEKIINEEAEIKIIYGENNTSKRQFVKKMFDNLKKNSKLPLYIPKHRIFLKVEEKIFSETWIKKKRESRLENLKKIKDECNLENFMLNQIDLEFRNNTRFSNSFKENIEILLNMKPEIHYNREKVRLFFLDEKLKEEKNKNQLIEFLNLGKGYQELVILSFILNLILFYFDEKENVIITIAEPEISLDPNLQATFFDFISLFSEKEQIPIYLITRSKYFLNLHPKNIDPNFEKIKEYHFQRNKIVEIGKSSPILNPTGTILVEGKRDIVSYSVFYKKFFGRSFTEENCKVIELNGISNITEKLNFQLQQSYKFGIILDSDIQEDGGEIGDHQKQALAFAIKNDYVFLAMLKEARTLENIINQDFGRGIIPDNYGPYDKIQEDPEKERKMKKNLSDKIKGLLERDESSLKTVVKRELCVPLIKQLTEIYEWIQLWRSRSRFRLISFLYSVFKSKIELQRTSLFLAQTFLIYIRFFLKKMFEEHRSFYLEGNILYELNQMIQNTNEIEFFNTITRRIKLFHVLFLYNRNNAKSKRIIKKFLNFIRKMNSDFFARLIKDCFEKSDLGIGNMEVYIPKEVFNGNIFHGEPVSFEKDEIKDSREIITSILETFLSVENDEEMTQLENHLLNFAKVFLDFLIKQEDQENMEKIIDFLITKKSKDMKLIKKIFRHLEKSRKVKIMKKCEDVEIWGSLIDIFYEQYPNKTIKILNEEIKSPEIENEVILNRVIKFLQDHQKVIEKYNNIYLFGLLKRIKIEDIEFDENIESYDFYSSVLINLFEMLIQLEPELNFSLKNCKTITYYVLTMLKIVDFRKDEDALVILDDCIDEIDLNSDIIKYIDKLNKIQNMGSILDGHNGDLTKPLNILKDVRFILYYLYLCVSNDDDNEIEHKLNATLECVLEEIANKQKFDFIHSNNFDAFFYLFNYKGNLSLMERILENEFLDLLSISDLCRLYSLLFLIEEDSHNYEAAYSQMEKLARKSIDLIGKELSQIDVENKAVLWNSLNSIEKIIEIMIKYSEKMSLQAINT